MFLQSLLDELSSTHNKSYWCYFCLQVLSLWSLLTISGLLAAISLSVCICISQSILASLFSVTVAGSCSYHFFQHLDFVVPICFPMYICSCPVVSEFSQFLQVLDSQTQCSLSFPCICCTSCTVEQCHLLSFDLSMV